jgi:soluble cytochrome b562
MKSLTTILALAGLLVAPAWASDTTSFETVMASYEPVRIALLADSMNDVNRHGAAIEAELQSLQAAFSAERAGVAAASAESVQDGLDEMIAAAGALAAAGSLQAARDAFYELSKPLVRWRNGVLESERPAVAFCPMHKRSWLQPDSEIGNPYGGMPRCGEIVAR